MENSVQNQPMPYKVLIVICLASFVTPFMGSSFNLALPQIAQHFSMNAVQLTWFSIGFIISTAIFQIPFARVADMVGRKKIFRTGLLGLAIITVLTPFAPHFYVLVMMRMLAGLFSAMMFGTSMAIMMAEVPLKHRALAISINVAFVYSALAAGPLFGGLLTHYAGWESICYTSGGLVFLLYGMSVFIFKDGKNGDKVKEKFDITGSIIYTIGIVGLIYGFTKLPHMQGFVCIAISIIAFVAFILYERKQQFPVLDVRLFATNRTFSLSCLASLINYAANSATSFMLSLYLQFVRGYDASFAGLVLISQAVVQVIFSILAGKLSSRFKPANLAAFGMGLSTLGLFSLVFLQPETNLIMFICALAALGAGFGLFSSPNTNVIMSSVEKKHYTQASATTGTMRLVGQSFSMGIAAMAISIYIGRAKLAPGLEPQFMMSLKAVFLIFAILCIFGIITSRMAKGWKI